MTTTCEWRGHVVANLSEMSSLEWFTTLDRDESQPRSALTPPGAPIYFRLRTLSHSTDTVHLANQIIVGCRWLPGSAAPAHRRQQKQRVSPDLSKKEFSLESLQQSVAFVAVGLRRRSSGSAAVAVCWSWRPRCGRCRRARLSQSPLPVAATCAGAVPVSAACWNQQRRRLLSARRRVRSAGPRCRGGGAAVRWSWRPGAAERRRRSWWPVSFCTAVWTRCRFPWSHSPTSCAGTGGPPRRVPSPTGPPPAESASARTTGRRGWCCVLEPAGGAVHVPGEAGVVLVAGAFRAPATLSPLCCGLRAPAAVVPRGSLDGRRRRQRPSRRSEQCRRPVPRPSEKHPALLSP